MFEALLEEKLPLKPALVSNQLALQHASTVSQLNRTEIYLDAHMKILTSVSVFATN